MKFLTRPIFMAILLVSTNSAFSQEAPVGVVQGNASVAIMSNYVWRGLTLSDKAVLQPTVGVTYGGFAANFWTNHDLDINETTETDLTLSYSFAASKFSFDVGYINYAFDGFADTQEFYLSAGLDTPLSPGLTLYYDFDEGSGAFLVATISHSIALSQAISIDLGASGSANFDNALMGATAAGDTFTGLYNADLSASAGIPISKIVTLVPALGFSFSLSDDARTAMEAISLNGDSNILYGGVAVSFDF